jgi:hypothetical protein
VALLPVSRDVANLSEKNHYQFSKLTKDKAGKFASLIFVLEALTEIEI